MRQRLRRGRVPRRYYFLAAGFVLLAIIIAVAAGPGRRSHTARTVDRQQDVPPDLAPLRTPFLEGIEAIQQGDASEAIRLLDSFTFGARRVEQYRLYYLGTAHQLAGETDKARLELARLWTREPEFVYWQDSAFTLASLYGARGDFRSASEMYERIAERAEHPAVGAAARHESIRARFFAGDPAAAYVAARELVIESPRTPQVRSSVRLATSLSGKPLDMTPAEQLERATHLIRDGDSRSALEELNRIAAVSGPMRNEIALQKGIALHRLRRYEDSNAQLEPLTSGPFKYSIPALEHASRNYALLAESIDPRRYKTVTEKKRTGSRKVKKGKRTVTVPVYRNVKRKVELIDLEDKKKKEEYERLRVERLKDLLLVRTSPEVRKRTLHTLAGLAIDKKQDDYIKELVTELVAIDPHDDTALQYLWDQGWAAYLANDHGKARDRFRFIEQRYINPNIKRQASYWYARSAEKSGAKEEAAKIYQSLASAPYRDLYAKFAESRGGKRPEGPISDPEAETREWGEIAEQEMPDELRLAYELNALGLARESRLELQKNATDDNRRYADAVLADLYYNAGSHDLAAVMMKRAFPAIATSEQDRVPRYFIDMYYPRKYQDIILKQAESRGVDPYLVMGLILQESRYDPEARSRVGATGLMQIMPPTGKELASKINRLFTERRLTDPAYNIELGTFYLRQLIRTFDGVEELAIAAYNGGQGNVRKWKRNNSRPLDEFVESIPFPETRNYVKRVTILRATYEELAERGRLSPTRATSAGAPASANRRPIAAGP